MNTVAMLASIAETLASIEETLANTVAMLVSMKD